MTGTTFPVTINSQVKVNALYDTGAARSCMNYDTVFNLGLDLGDKPAPHVRTASGTDMGAIGFTTLMFAINNHMFTQQFIVCRSHTRPLILGQDFCVSHCTGFEWTPHGTKRFTTNHKLILEIDGPEADQFCGAKKSVNIPPRHYGIVRYRVPEFPHSSATFNIIFRIPYPGLPPKSYKDHWATVHVLCSAVNHTQHHLTGLTWFPIVLNYIK